MKTHQATAPLILAIDDQPANLKLIVNCLKTEGFQMIVARDGPMGIQRARLLQPALILLDVMMPQMDGFETCRHLKSETETREIPVIFLTALSQEDNKVKGFDVGGVDYITKPIQPKELVARVKTHVMLADMHRRLREQNAQLAQEIAERKRIEMALREANTSKDTFFSILAHDLRSPFTGLLGLTEVVLHYLDSDEKDELRTNLRLMKASTESVYALLENLLTWSRLQRGLLDYTPRLFSLSELITNLVSLFTAMAEQKHIHIAIRVDTPLALYADVNMISTVLRNLLSNALKFTYPGGQIEISARHVDAMVEVAVADTGVGIAAEDVAKLFRIDAKFTTPGTASERGSGLGLVLCRDLILQNKGQLWVESQPQQGTTFTFRMPCPISSSIMTNAADTPQPPITHAETAPHFDVAGIRWAIQRLPSEILIPLREAVESLNLSAIHAIIERLHQHDDTLAAHLTEMLIEQYRFDLVQEMFVQT